MKVEVHLLTWNEEELLPYTLRHYRTFATDIFVHDAFSTDRTRAIAEEYGAIVWDWDTGNEFNDLHALNLKNRCWRGTDAGWVIAADCDELVYCYLPCGMVGLLEQYDALEFAVIKPHGFEMYSPTWPTTSGQIYEEVKHGAEHPAYAKPILFAPGRLQSIEFGAGAHQCQYTRAGGRRFEPHDCTVPACYLLHYHQIGPIERIAQRYDERRRRLARINVERRWGNIDQTGMEHAIAKRDLILSTLQQVVA
jgi:glycosyltransferase involved in cell wall biosynthesis